MNLHDQNTRNGQKSWNGLTSPSNLAMAALIGFLFVGQATDWKILFGRKSKSISSVKFGTPGLSQGHELSRTGVQHSRPVRARSLRDAALSDAALHDSTLRGSTRTDPNSEVADRRSLTREAQKSQRELD